MAHTHHMTLHRDDADGNELSYEVEYRISPGCPEQGPTYACGGQPAEPPEVVLVAVTLAGTPYTADDLDDWFIRQIVEKHEFDEGE